MPVLVLFAVAISLFSFAKLFKPWLTDSVYHAIYGTVSWANTLLFSSFLFVLLSKIFKKSNQCAGAGSFGYYCWCGIKILLPKGLSYFGLFVPTLLHVYVFTVLFMLYGLRKSQHPLGASMFICWYWFLFYCPFAFPSFGIIAKRSRYGCVKRKQVYSIAFCFGAMDISKLFKRLCVQFGFLTEKFKFSLPLPICIIILIGFLKPA